jgi:hypothetical protein
MRTPKRQREPSWQEAAADVRRAIEAELADRRLEPQAAAAASPSPEAEEDMDLFRFDLAYRLRARLCVSPRRCENHRCRRLGRCRELFKTARLRDAHRARVARDGGPTAKRGADSAVKVQRNH